MRVARAIPILLLGVLVCLSVRIDAGTPPDPDGLPADMTKPVQV